MGRDRSDHRMGDEALGRAIRVARTERGLNRKELAEGSGLSYPYLSEIEAGKKSPSSRALKAVAEALGMSASELMVAADSLADRIPPAPPAPAAAPATRPMASPPEWFHADLAVAADAEIPRNDRTDLIADLERHARALTVDDLERLVDLAARLRGT